MLTESALDAAYGGPAANLSLKDDVRGDATVKLGALLGRILGWTWASWFPTAAEAWLSILAQVRGRTVIAAAGAEASVVEAAQIVNAEIVEVDLDRETGAPCWPRIGSKAFPTALLMAHRHGLPVATAAGTQMVMEDASDAIGARWMGAPVGSVGDISLVRLGQGPFSRSRGALVGSSRRSTFGEIASGGTWPPPAAELFRLVADLTTLEEWAEGCRAASAVYDSAWRPLNLPLAVVGVDRRGDAPRSSYLILVDDARQLVDTLLTQGIEAARPIPPRLGALFDRQRDRFRGAEAFYRRVVRLPSHPGLGLGELLYVADAVRAALQRRRSPTKEFSSGERGEKYGFSA